MKKQSNPIPALIHVMTPMITGVVLIFKKLEDVEGVWSVVDLNGVRYMTNYRKLSGEPISQDDILGLIAVAEYEFMGSVVSAGSAVNVSAYSAKIAKEAATTRVFIYKEGMVPFTLRRIGRREMIGVRSIDAYNHGTTICADDHTGLNTNTWKTMACEIYDDFKREDGEKNIFDLLERSTKVTLQVD